MISDIKKIFLFVLIFFGCEESKIEFDKNVLFFSTGVSKTYSILDTKNEKVYEISRILGYPVRKIYDLHSYDYFNKIIFGVSDSLIIYDFSTKIKYSVPYNQNSGYAILSKSSFFVQERTNDDYGIYYRIGNNSNLISDTIFNYDVGYAIFDYSAMFEYDNNIYYSHSKYNKIKKFDLLKRRTTIFNNSILNGKGIVLGNMLLINGKLFIDVGKKGSHKILTFNMKTMDLINEIETRHSLGIEKYEKVCFVDKTSYILSRENDQYLDIKIGDFVVFSIFKMVGNGNHYLFNLDDYSFTRMEIYDKYFRSNLIADFIDKENMHIFDMKAIDNIVSKSNN